MRVPTDEDFAALRTWGLDRDPLASIKDYTELKNQLRWINPQNRDAHWAYVKRREEWIEQRNFDHYYRVARKPIERAKWEYLKQRKAWYTPPLEWDRFAAAAVTRILDLGCGDGDVTQRVMDHIAAVWAKKGYAGHDVEVVGIDLNESRVENARGLVVSPHPRIRASFATGDAVKEQLPYRAQHFDYVLNTGVLEILEDAPAEKMLDEIGRLAAKGVYIEDIVDHYPGGYPREHLPSWLNARGFMEVKRFFEFSEPFALEGSLDPLQLWPIIREQVLFAGR
jgi:SAM-dependent methyltransferase